MKFNRETLGKCQLIRQGRYEAMGDSVGNFKGPGKEFRRLKTEHAMGRDAIKLVE